ncbi:MAG: hypothetical protein ABEH35_02070 [Haloarculaceae archaeon]
MTEPLPVHVNRQELHSLEVPDGIEVEGSFDIDLVNHGESVHVHLHLDDALSEVATIDANNHYVQGDSRRQVRVTVDGTGEVHGKLKVVTAYGATTRYVDIDVVEPEEEQTEVAVDESLAQPQPTEPEESSSLRDSALPVLGLGALALGVAAVGALVIDSAIVSAGALAVLAGVLVALYFMLVE